MKKLIFLGLIMLQVFAFSANATTKLWKSVSFCWENERIKLKDDFTFELWGDNILQFEGTWDFEDDELNAINLTIDVDGTSRVFHMRITEKQRPVADRYSGERYVRILKVEFNEVEYVHDEYCN